MMNKVIFPLEVGMQSNAVGDLQDALQLLLDKGMLLKDNEAAKQEILKSKDWASEREKNNYCTFTNKLVTYFQKEKCLNPSKFGKVDELTASAINRLLAELGVLDDSSGKRPFIVSGAVLYDNNFPLKGKLVRVFQEFDKNKILLGEGKTDADGHYTIRYELLPEIVNVNMQIEACEEDGIQLTSLKIAREIKPLEIANLFVIIKDVELYQVVGKVTSKGSASVSGLRVLVMDKGVGGDLKLVEVVTNDSGAYNATFSGKELQQRVKERPDLQVIVYGGEKLLGTSEVHYNASNLETFNVILEEKVTPSLRSEHEVLTDSISIHFKGNLSDLKETDEQQDITYLANKTGWDARAVALAALADQFSARTRGKSSTEIEPPFFYALFRAGLPANENALYQVNPLTAKNIWEQAISQGVIPAELENKLPSVIEAFNKLEAEQILEIPASVGVSSLMEMLKLSLGKDNTLLHKKFADIYTKYRQNPSKLWEEVKNDTDLGEKAANRLRLDGRLAYLTLNNAPLINKLHTDRGEIGLNDPLNLVEDGYYHPEKWETIVSAWEIPQEIPGANKDEKRVNYSELLASMMRLSYPTAVVAQMVKKSETPVAEGLADSIYNFLVENHGKFEFGVQPIEQFIAQKSLQSEPEVKEVYIEPEVVKEIKSIQRVYQITPSHNAMNKLLNKGIDSAFAVISHDRDEFVRNFKEDVDGEVNARMIYEKAQQVHNTALNIAISYLTAKVLPGIGVQSAQIVNPTPIGPNPHSSDVIAYSTLESLFGEMDYCTCEHCRSILSPAAYLVDLLKFIDLKSYNAQGTELPRKYEKENPLDVLLGRDDLPGRRPEIQYIPLTCENTNTPLPYIDLVNETLEYFITNNFSLKNYTGHSTTGEVEAEELMASPMFVRNEAYITLNEAFFPPPLPFHQPLENLRRYFNRFEAPLPKLMEELRKDDNLERVSLNNYGWRDILMEELNFSRSEYSLLTKSERTSGKPEIELTVKKLYGFDDSSDDLEKILYGVNNVANQPDIPGLSNAKVFTRRVGISYDDIVEILKTRFINSNSALIPKLEKLGYHHLVPKIEKLGVSYKTIQNFYDGKLSDAEFEAMLPGDIDKSQYGGDIKQWLRDNFNQIVRNIGVNFQTIKDFVKGDENGELLAESAFRTLIPIEEIDITQFGGKLELSNDEKYIQIEDWIRKNYEQIMGLILLTDPTRSGDVFNFEKLELQHSNPDNNSKKVRATEFVRLIRFIRLWKKLGWTIEQTDKAITALYPPNQVPDDAEEEVILQRLDEDFLILLPRLGVLKKVIETFKLKLKEDLLPLLACFSLIDTHGTGSLYREMFLSPATLKQDKIFADEGNGQFLTDSTQKLIAFAEAICGAFNLTEEEFFLIFNSLGFHDKSDVQYEHIQITLEQPILNAAPGINYDNENKRLSYNGFLSIETCDALKKVNGVSDAFKKAVDDLYAENQKVLTPLTLDNISAIFRRGWLARKLKLSIREFILLTQFTGIDPFVPPDPVNPPILRLLEHINRLQSTSLKLTQALYLIWNQDISGRSVPDISEITGLAQTLRSDLSVIEREFVLVDDPTGQITRARMELVYGKEATDFFFGLLGNTLITSADYSHDQVALITNIPYDRAVINLETNVPYDHHKANLEQPILDVAPDLIVYNDQLKLLSTLGELTEAVRNSLKNIAKEILNPQQAIDFIAAVENLYVENQKVLQAKLEQTIVNVAPGRITYVDYKLLSFEGVLTETTRNALKNAAKETLSPQQTVDDFIAAVDKLYEENQKVIKANLQQSIADAGLGRITYDDSRKLLLYNGFMTNETRDSLIKVEGVSETFKKAVVELYNNNHNLIEPFFNRYPKLEKLYNTYVSSTDLTEKKLSDLLAIILPELKLKRKKQQALQVICTAANTNVEFASVILDNKSIEKYVLHGANDTTIPAIDDLIAIEKQGLSAQFYFRSTATDEVDLSSDHEENLAYNASNKLPANPDPNNPKISGIWRGYLEPPENDFYSFRIEADLEVNVNLYLDGVKITLEQNGRVWSSKKIELRAGNLYAIYITVENVKERLNILWESTGRGWETIPSSYLYSATLTEHLHQDYIRFLKVVSLSTLLKLTATKSHICLSLLNTKSMDKAG